MLNAPEPWTLADRRKNEAELRRSIAFEAKLLGEVDGAAIFRHLSLDHSDHNIPLKHHVPLVHDLKIMP